MQNKKNILAGVIVLVIIVVLIGLYQRYQNEEANSAASQTSGTGENSNASGTSPEQATSTPPTTTTTTKKLSYGDAIKAYPNRIQFVNCGGNPGSISVKRNTPVMLDNRDSKKHTVKGAGQSFTIAGYDYAVMYPKIEGTFQLTCDGGGSSMLNVEK